MDIRYKLYPYPVLTPYSDDYIGCSFSTDIEMVRDGFNYRIEFKSTLTSNTIQQLISNGKASYVYHLECAQTGFREVIITQNVQEQYPLDKRLVCGKLQVCSFVVTRDDLHNFTSPEFHADYANVGFDIEAGCVIAVGTQINFFIDKEIDDIANLPSIFGIIKNADETVKEMLVDYDQRKIIIKLPLNDYYTYKYLSKEPNNAYILNSLTIIPALTYVMGEIKLLNVDERGELDCHVWYRTIKKVLLNKFGIDIEDINSNEKFDSLEFAQKLVNDPLTDAFNYLYNDDDNGGDGQ